FPRRESRSFSERSFQSSTALDQVEKRKKEYPNNVYEVPIQAAQLNGRVVNRTEFISPRQKDQDRHQPDSNNHVQGMHACHDEVEDEKQACVSAVGSIPHEERPWYQMLFKFLVVLVEFYSQENHAQRRSDREKQHDHPAVSLLRFVDAQRHRQTAAQQNACVDGAQDDVQMSTGFAKRRVIQHAIHRVTDKHSSEEQDLGREET